MRGHEFHRTVTDPAAGPSPAWGWRTPAGPHTEGHLHGSVHASYLHLHWTGAPALPARLVRHAAAWAAGRDGS